ncbi:sensor histidine kinase [Flavisolibacter ginsenosidimutans]|uniref:histidine kinase n=1 Tax=Flavisolibacter ginsenosidimutans TaxID=661481 RepID=A0A5B8UDV5_9BACT|nr:HAMP domain-containing sensor histidine kinase [Flavisolibacter ginsenosidimutans]QEC54486.1 HAMP domain-containing histidine kinase [Flavisolibacter ginsenosidimutans]
MKLLTKTTLYFLLAIIPLLAASGYLLFSRFNAQINERADKELVYEELQWIDYLDAATASGNNFILRSPDLLIYPEDGPATNAPELSTIYSARAGNGVQIPFRQLSDVVAVNGVTYRIFIRKSQEQKLALVANIATSMLVVFGGLLLATLLFNWIISRRLWQPFYESLHKIQTVELPKMQALRFDESSTEEFNQLNASLNTMAAKIHSDYITVKEFTEDAAHEMQTPLAVAQSKLELLLQDSNLNATQAEAVVQASDALQRLGKLNQSLLLLAKIEANQFEATGTINLVDVTKKYLTLFDAVIKDKELLVETNFTGDFGARLHPFLADSLVSNLLGNAIKYNFQGGKISITVTKNDYSICNASQRPPIKQENLFRRFKTSPENGETSNGLGLAIVKKIADANDMTVRYEATNNVHCFHVANK